MARIRRRGHDPLLCFAHARRRPDQVNSAKDHRRRHQLALPRRAQTRAEGVSAGAHAPRRCLGGLTRTYHERMMCDSPQGHIIGTSRMPDFFADPPAPSCSLLLPENEIQESQPLGPDLWGPRARAGARALLPPLAPVTVAVRFWRALAMLAMLVMPAYAAAGERPLPVIGPAPSFA